MSANAVRPVPTTPISTEPISRSTPKPVPPSSTGVTPMKRQPTPLVLPLPTPVCPISFTARGPGFQVSGRRLVRHQPRLSLWLLQRVPPPLDPPGSLRLRRGRYRPQCRFPDRSVYGPDGPLTDT